MAKTDEAKRIARELMRRRAPKKGRRMLDGGIEMAARFSGSCAACAGPISKGKLIRFFPKDHPEWPGYAMHPKCAIDLSATRIPQRPDRQRRAEVGGE